MTEDDLVDMISNQDFRDMINDLYQTQTAFCDDTGLNRQHVNRIWNDKAPPSRLMIRFLQERTENHRLLKRLALAETLAAVVRELAGPPSAR